MLLRRHPPPTGMRHPCWQDCATSACTPRRTRTGMSILFGFMPAAWRECRNPSPSAHSRADRGGHAESGRGPRSGGVVVGSVAAWLLRARDMASRGTVGWMAASGWVPLMTRLGSLPVPAARAPHRQPFNASRVPTRVPGVAFGGPQAFCSAGLLRAAPGALSAACAQLDTCRREPSGRNLDSPHPSNPQRSRGRCSGFASPGREPWLLFGGARAATTRPCARPRSCRRAGLIGPATDLVRALSVFASGMISCLNMTWAH